MPKKHRVRTYLVAVYRKRESARVYALMARSTAEASEIVAARASDDVRVKVVGMLSAHMAKPYDLKTDDLIPI